MEYLPLARTLALGRPYALGTLLLVSVYQAMCKYVFDEPYHKVGGDLWFVQIGSLHIFQSFWTGNLPLTRLWDLMSCILYFLLGIGRSSIDKLIPEA